MDLPKLGRSDISPDKPFSFVGRGVKNTTTVGCDYFAREQAVLHKGFLELALVLLAGLVQRFLHGLDNSRLLGW